MAFEFLYEDGEEEGVFVRGGRWIGVVGAVDVPWAPCQHAHSSGIICLHKTRFISQTYMQKASYSAVRPHWHTCKQPTT